MLNIEEVQKFLGEYASLFDYTVREGYLIAKPKKRIETETFSDIGKLVRGKGEYVKWDKVAKKGGYFRFKGETAVSTATLDTNKNKNTQDHSSQEQRNIQDEHVPRHFFSLPRNLLIK